MTELNWVSTEVVSVPGIASFPLPPSLSPRLRDSPGALLRVESAAAEGAPRARETACSLLSAPASWESAIMVVWNVGGFLRVLKV